jgi:hypothetical protein
MGLVHRRYGIKIDPNINTKGDSESGDHGNKSTEQ